MSTSWTSAGGTCAGGGVNGGMSRTCMATSADAADQMTDCEGAAGRLQDLQRAGCRRLDVQHRLLALDRVNDVAFLDGCAVGEHPFGELHFGHGVARGRNLQVRHFVISSAARTMAAAP